MESTPFISVIIPTYNSARNIESCINSVIAQTWERKEIIVIDGASRDKTLDILKGIGERHLFIHSFSEKDSGIYDAMNKGIGKASGDWFFFLGSDDVLKDERVFEDVASVITPQSCDVIYGSVLIAGDTSWCRDGDIYDGPFTLDKIAFKNISHQAIFYKAEVFKKHGVFNINYPISADWDFNLRLWKATRWLYMDRIVTIFRGGGASTQAVDSNFRKDFFKIIEANLGMDPFHPVVNDPGYYYHKEIRELQKRRNIFKYIAYRGISFARRVLQRAKRLITKQQPSGIK